MRQTWLIGDTHFGHANILKFLKKDGTKLRPYFNDVDHMNDTIISNWNAVVRPDDKVYHLGDVSMCSFSLTKKIFDELNGTKVLIKGNHDNFKLSQYQQLFKDVRAYHVLDKIALAHIPIHPGSIERWKGQIHGHTHYNCLEDPRYYNVSVEVINYTPVNFDIIKKYYEELQPSN